MSWPALLEWSGKLDTSMHHTCRTEPFERGMLPRVLWGHNCRHRVRGQGVLQSGSPHELPQSGVVVFSFRVEFLDLGPQVTPSGEILSEELIVELPTV
ncbi:hypothetical protein BHM03_00036501 [Ensete ventricosum]|nr:hypothetical protein BHM03_00036501 [Ensete ventricosum]